MVVGCTLIFAMTENVLECAAVAGPFGMEDGHIPDASITVSSQFSNSLAPTRVRLNSQAESGTSGWCKGNLEIRRSGNQEVDPWIQVDLGFTSIITSVITQGYGDTSWVASFKVAYSGDGQEWTAVTNNGSSFPVNYDSNTQVTTSFPRAFQARFLRIVPTACTDDTQCICMRFEVVGCCACRCPVRRVPFITHV
ncbi:lactadherin-like [Patiria miniata]|uniref:F5/8 type C domain-containing protein n=1 Tax=Patiria miniata TaxID=46514 RepID=A0A914BE19_PATMI|nr:lactadherin-like [Patiria miniata]